MKGVSKGILFRVYLLFAVFILFGCLIILRSFSLQLEEEFWTQSEMSKRIVFKRLIADRGNILAEDGSILATSIPFYRIAMDPSVPDTLLWEGYSDSLYQLASNIAWNFGGESKDTAAVYARLFRAHREGKRFVYLTHKVLNYKELEMVKTWPIIRQGRYKGGFLTEKLHNKRFYPFGNLASITLGRMSGDTLGIRGIEASYNTDLRGRDGYILAQKMAGDAYIPLDEYGEEKALDGYDIRTTLDVRLQEIVNDALRKGVTKSQANYGVAILLEVKTGEIKALANYPETYNNAIGTKFEPGSTFKIASATAVMQDGIMELCDTVDAGDGVIEYIDQQLTDAVGYGRIPFEKVVARSSNVGMSKVVYENYKENPEAFLWHLKQFGFYEPAGRDIKGEPQPTILEPGNEYWNETTLPSMAIGYSLEVTPLQMAAFYNGIANEGKLLRPWLVKEIRDNSRVVRSFGPEVVNPQMCSRETAIKSREIMKAVIRYGTARRQFTNMPFEVAGKTGTARKTVGKEYVKRYRVSFAGFFPADDPKFTLFIMLDEPKGKNVSGARNSGPIFREIAVRIHAVDERLAIPPAEKYKSPVRKPAGKIVHKTAAEAVYTTLGIETSSVPENDWLRARSNNHQINLKAYEPGNRVPNLRGLTTRDAMALMESMGCTVRLSGNGRVRRQSLLPGYRVSRGANITLYCR